MHASSKLQNLGTKNFRTIPNGLKIETTIITSASTSSHFDLNLSCDLVWSWRGVIHVFLANEKGRIPLLVFPYSLLNLIRLHAISTQLLSRCYCSLVLEHIWYMFLFVNVLNVYVWALCNSKRDRQRQRWGKKETDRQTETEIGKERDRQTDRQTETEVGKERDRQTDRDRGGERKRQTDRDRGGERKRQTDRQRQRWGKKETDRQTETEVGKERDRQTDRDRCGERKRDSSSFHRKWKEIVLERVISLVSPLKWIRSQK